MKGVIRRLEGLEKEVKPVEPRKVIVDWSEHPEPAKPGETVITWDDIDYEAENDDED